MPVNTVYVVPLSGDGSKIEFTLAGKGGVKVAVTDPSTTIITTFPLADLLEIATNLEMDSTPEGEKKNE